MNNKGERSEHLINYTVGTKFEEAGYGDYSAGRAFCANCKKITAHYCAYDPSDVKYPRSITWCGDCKIITKNERL